MGRPSKSKEKREQILDAFERVIIKDGYGKASQRRIAAEAGVNQPMIHHYFSGGDEMLEALLKRIVRRFMLELGRFDNSSEPTLAGIVSFLCSKEFHQVSKQNEVFFFLLGQSGSNDPVLRKMVTVYERFLAQLSTQLRNASIDDPEDVAYVMMCLMIGHDVAKMLGFGELRNDVMVSKLKLIADGNI